MKDRYPSQAVTDKEEIDAKIQTLDEYIKSTAYLGLTIETKVNLSRQLYVMQEYSMLLEAYILASSVVA